jgi:hypothetical protein
MTKTIYYDLKRGACVILSWLTAAFFEMCWRYA